MTEDTVIELVKADARRHTPSHSKNLEVFQAESMTLHGIRKTTLLTVCWNDEHFSYEKGIHGVVVNLEDSEWVKKTEPTRFHTNTRLERREPPAANGKTSSSPVSLGDTRNEKP